MGQNPKTILYVDDDADDREFLAEAIHDLNPQANVVLAEDGLKALDYLRNSVQNRDGLPCVIILDINMPYLNGVEVFDKIRQEKELAHLPIVMFSSSENPNDKALFRSRGVELISKPDNIEFLHGIASRMLSVCA